LQYLIKMNNTQISQRGILQLQKQTEWTKHKEGYLEIMVHPISSDLTGSDRWKHSTIGGGAQ